MLWSESYVRVHVCLQITTRFRSLSESLAKDKAGSQGRRGQQSVEVGGSGREEDVGGSGQDAFPLRCGRLSGEDVLAVRHEAAASYLACLSRIVCGGYLPARYTCLLQTTDKHKHADAENGERE